MGEIHFTGFFLWYDTDKNSRYQERGGAQDVLDAIDSINIHMLPFFSQNASTGKDAPY